MFDDHPYRTTGDSPLPEHAAKVTTTTGEFATRRRLAIEVPADAPPEKVRLKLRAEVECSLREVCGNWPTGEFDRVVADVTSTAMKYHRRERRRNMRSVSAPMAPYIPGATTVAAILTTAMQSVQRFLHLETLPIS